MLHSHAFHNILSLSGFKILNIVDMYERVFRPTADAINLLFFCQSAL